MEEIAKKWREYIKGHDEDWIYDMSDEFFTTLSRREYLQIANYLSEQFPQN